MRFRWRHYAGSFLWVLLYDGDEVGRVEPSAEMICPFCNGECEAEFVDVGVGGRGPQVSPYYCGRCGAQETRDPLVKMGWEHGQNTIDAMEHPAKPDLRGVTRLASNNPQILGMGTDARAVRMATLRGCIYHMAVDATRMLKESADEAR